MAAPIDTFAWRWVRSTAARNTEVLDDRLMPSKERTHEYLAVLQSAMEELEAAKTAGHVAGPTLAVDMVPVMTLPIDPLLAHADRKSTRLNSSHSQQSRMPSSA